jgi:hypothetical protein
MKKKEVCVFGLFHKEAFFIPYWQQYYGSLFGYENLYALGDLQNDIFLKMFHKDVNKIELGAKYQCDYGLHVNTIMHMQKSLLNFYKVVIFAEADEFIVADPEKYKDLNDFFSKNNEDYFRCSGYNIIADLVNELPINPSRPLLSQRKYWYLHDGECKTLVARKPVDWYGVGFHECKPVLDLHSDLYNIHFHEFDYEIQNTRIQLRHETNLPLHPDFRPGGLGGEGFLFDERLIEYHNSKFYSKNLQEIPDKFKNYKLI